MKKNHYYRGIFYDFSTYKGIYSKTQPLFPENTASAKPIGAAIYKTATDMSEELRHALPDIEELKELL